MLNKYQYDIMKRSTDRHKCTESHFQAHRRYITVSHVNRANKIHIAEDTLADISEKTQANN